MDFSHNSLSVSVGLSSGNLNFVGERSLPSLTTERGETRHRLSVGQPMSPSLLSPNNLLKHCRPRVDMDLDLRDDSRGPLKLARTDSFMSRQPDLKMQITSSGTLGSLVRSNSSVSDGRLGSSPTNSTVSDGALLGNESNFISEPRLMKNESLVLNCPQYSGGNPRAMSFLQQACSYRSSALPLSFGKEIVNQMGFHDNDRAPPPFSLGQFRELQHQALIFKYMMSGVNVPAELIVPIRTSVLGLATMTGNFGWGNYHLSFANNTDPEPGRCRRTDGKKWRCAREVVPDQKYCERHMHRGRHRARKPAENQAISSSQSTAATGSSSATAASASFGASRGSTTPSTLDPSIAMNTQHNMPTSNIGLKSYPGSNPALNGSVFQLPLQSGVSGVFAKDYRYLNGLTKSEINLDPEQIFLTAIPGNTRGLAQESQPMSGLSMLSSVNNSWRGGLSTKQPQHLFFGSGFGGAETVQVSHEPEGQPLRHFFDDWPRPRDPSALSWSDLEEERSNHSSSTTQLSISIPMTSSDFNTATANSPRGKLSLSPLKLSMSRTGEEDPLGVDPTQMALGVGNMGLGMNEERHRQTNWIPIIWETSPLAEVLQSNTPRGCCKSSGLNLMTDGWENSPRDSPRMTSSPTGVLQNATFGSLSDSSNGSSPRATTKTEPGLCGDNLHQSSDSFSGSNIEPSSC